VLVRKSLFMRGVCECMSGVYECMRGVH
jgi:hypothetical protein